MKKILKGALAGAAIALGIYSNNLYAVANIRQYTYDTEEKNVTTEKLVNGTTLTYSKPSSVYDFFDENGNLNTIYTSEENVYWATFDENMEITSTVKMAMYFDKSNSPESYHDIIFNFGNALYYNEHLYVVYGQQADTSSDDLFNEVSMAVVKYDKEGNTVAVNEIVGTQLNPTTFWDLGGGDWEYGTSLPFATDANCSLTVNEDGLIACFFGRQMFNSHQSSMMFFIDAETMEYVSNRYYTTDENVAKFTEPGSYYVSHSFAQRVVATSDGGFIMVDSGDAGLKGATRGINVSKIYAEGDILKLRTSKMVHYSEGRTGSHGYNCTYSSIGNIIELSDGYMYVGSMQPTLSLEYGKKISESWDVFVQKYTKDFYTKETVEEMQMFDTPVREATGTPPEDAYKGDAASQGRIYLTGDEKDYGIKWLTDLQEKHMAILVRAVELEDDNIAILWEQLKMEDLGNGNYDVWDYEGDVYYMIIDKDANIVFQPTKIPDVRLNEEEYYMYKDGKIYWTTAVGGKKITVNVLDIANPLITKGDLNQDGLVDSADAAIALNIFKYDSATEQDLEIGDMDGNGMIDSADAATILNIFKYNN